MANREIYSGRFFLDLTVGLVQTLKNISKVRDVEAKSYVPCQTAQINAWEAANGVRLPSDMKKFYQSTDGLNVQWTYQYSKLETHRVGHLKIPRLAELRNLKLNIPEKVFEIDSIGDVAKIYLVYLTSGITIPKIYLVESANMKGHLLADSFATYFRMSIAHLGLPHWQLAFASCGLPGWAEQLFLLLAPHLLDRDDTPPRPNQIVYNVLDPDIFLPHPIRTDNIVRVLCKAKKIKKYS
ncbi:tubulin polyglutamylase complex subunit 2-like [Anopheles maculipalpis]|uniref:tubulin polyglutamylase complex subunit 2-like n=1 Tax=Anopheles maculipalpis TaxID=1496333 RepID=UPI0021590A0E|nr:tubulin polyglutamylase complex subunit 2-like [Anopheles maculipalpis]